MSVSLVICTLGRLEPLRRLLTSLRASTVTPLELLLVDQNPAGFLDTVLADFTDQPLAHLSSERGLSRARNVGLAVAKADIVAFPDDDCWYPSDVISRVEAMFAKEPKLSLLTGRTVDASGLTSVSPHIAETAAITRDNVFQIGNSNGLFVRRSLAQAAGGFNETLGVGAASPFQSGEETDFVLRCLGIGATGRYDPALLIHHDQADPQAASHIDRVSGYSAGFGRVLRLHGYRWSAVAIPVARAGGSALICTARRDFEGAAQRRAWIAGTLRGFLAAPWKQPTMKHPLQIGIALSIADAGDLWPIERELQARSACQGGAAAHGATKAGQ